MSPYRGLVPRKLGLGGAGSKVGNNAYRRCRLISPNIALHKKRGVTVEAVRADNRAAREAVPYLTDDKTQSHPTEGNPETHHHGGPQEPRPHGWVKSSLRFSARQIQSPPRGVAGGKFD